MPDQLLNVDAVAEYLGVPKARAYTLLRSDKLPAIRLGRQVRVSRVALEAFCASGGAPLTDADIAASQARRERAAARRAAADLTSQNGGPDASAS